MVSATVTITTPYGLHMRPAGVLASAMGAYEASIELIVHGQTVNAKSVMALIAAAIKEHDDVEICCEGADEQAALQHALQLLQDQA